MGRPLRCHERGSYSFVTSRCLQSQALLQPDRELSALFGLWLGRSLARHPGLALHGAVVLHDRLHLLVRDGRGELSRFMGYLLGNFGKSVNRLRGRSGPCFHARYDAGRILDTHAAVECLARLVSAPVGAGLVARVERWQGVHLYARNARGAPESHAFAWFDHSAWHRRTRRNPRAAREAFVRHASVVVRPLPFTFDPARTALLGGRTMLHLAKGARRHLASFPRADRAASGELGATHAALRRAREAADPPCAPTLHPAPRGPSPTRASRRTTPCASCSRVPIAPSPLCTARPPTPSSVGPPRRPPTRASPSIPAASPPASASIAGPFGWRRGAPIVSSGRHLTGGAKATSEAH